MARVLFPPPDPQDLGTTRKSAAAASKSGPAGSLPHTGWREQQLWSTPLHPPSQGCRARATPTQFMSHKPSNGLALKEKRPCRRPSSPTLHLTCCVITSTWRSLSGPQIPPWETRAEALVLCGSSCPRQTALGTRSSKAWRVCSKEPSALAAWLRAPISLRISPLSSFLPPAQSPMVAPNYHITENDSRGENASHP